MQSNINFNNSLLLIMIITGAIDTLAYKYQNSQLVYEGEYLKKFFHPYMQALSVFIGCFLCLIVFFILKKIRPEKFEEKMRIAQSQGKQIQFNPFWLAIPAFCGYLTNTLQLIALNFISGSVYQILRGGVIITTALFSYFFLKMKIRRNHLLGCTLVIIGIVIVGLSNFIFRKPSTSSSIPSELTVIGYILITISLISGGFYFVFQQKLFSKYHIQPLQVTGYEGLFGIGYYAITLPIITFVHCNFGVQSCVANSQSSLYIERPQMYFKEAGQNVGLLLFIILGIISIAFFNISGVSVTKYIDALARSLADVARTIIIWIVGLIVTATLGVDHFNYRWQLTQVGAILMELAGFILLVFGNLIYNKIITNKMLVGQEEVAAETSQQIATDSAQLINNDSKNE